jgi:hypothetical protein
MILPLVVVAIVRVALPVVVIITSVMSFCHMADFLIEPLVQFVMHLASHALLDLMLAFLCQGAICYLQIKNVLEVLCNRLKYLIAKMSATLDVLYPVLFVKEHIEPLELYQHLSKSRALFFNAQNIINSVCKTVSQRVMNSCTR